MPVKKTKSNNKTTKVNMLTVFLMCSAFVLVGIFLVLTPGLFKSKINLSNIKKQKTKCLQHKIKKYELNIIVRNRS
jgi:hypothetical protein